MFPNQIIPKPSIYQKITKKERNTKNKDIWLGFQLKLNLVVFGIIIIQFHNTFSAKILYFNIIPAEMDRVCHCSDLNVLLFVLKAVC